MKVKHLGGSLLLLGVAGLAFATGEAVVGLASQQMVEVAAPGTPPSGTVVLYARDGLLYSKDDAGAETQVSGGGGDLATVMGSGNSTPDDGTNLQILDGDDLELQESAADPAMVAGSSTISALTTNVVVRFDNDTVLPLSQTPCSFARLGQVGYISATLAGGSPTSIPGYGLLDSLTFTDSASSQDGNGKTLALFKQDTAASSGSDALWESSSAEIEGAHRPVYVFVGNLENGSSIRSFFGLSSVDGSTIVGGDSVSGSYLGLSFSTPNADSNFQFIHNESSNTPTRVDTGEAVSGSQLLFCLEWNSTTSVVFTLWVDGSFVVQSEVTTDIPADNVAMYVVGAIESQAALVRSFRTGYAYLINRSVTPGLVR